MIEGNEYIKFSSNSTPYVEKLGYKFEKDNKREINTIVNYIKKLKINIYLKRMSWNSFQIFTFDKDKDKRILFELELFDESYISEHAKETKKEELERKLKIKDVDEIIEYILMNTDNTQIYNEKNFSINDWMIEQKLLPHEILKRRIIQLITYCNYHRIFSIRTDENLKNYLTDYLQLILRRTLNNPDEFNYLIGLRINKYLSQDKYLQFNIILKKICFYIKNCEKITYDRIQQFVYEYNRFEEFMIDYVDYLVNKGR